MIETTFIYALIDPRNNQVRYIGKSNHPERRLIEHIKDSEDTYKRRWIQKLLKLGFIPELLILDEVKADSWNFWEGFYYELYKGWGFKLTNTGKCGEGNFKHSIETINKIKRSVYKVVKYKDGKVLTDEEIELKVNKVKVPILRKIYQICNTTNQVINIFENRIECYKFLNIRKNRLDELLLGYQVIGKGVTKKVKQWKGFVFIKESEYDLNKDYKVVARKAVEVNQYNIQGDLISSYKSIKLASEATGISSGNISACCSPNNIQKTTGGYIFKYNNI